MGYVCMNVGVKVRAALLTAVARKALHMGRLSGESASDVVNAVATDVGKVYDGLQVRTPNYRMHTVKCSTRSHPLTVVGFSQFWCQHTTPVFHTSCYAISSLWCMPAWHASHHMMGCPMGSYHRTFAHLC
jgi:hypothetical protein